MSRSRVPWLYRFVRDRQAQSEPLAVILLVGLTLVGAGTVVVFGANAIDESATSVDVAQAEHAMTQLDSKASLVAHGSSDSQRVSLRENGRGTTSVDNDAGRMTVRIINGTHGNETILNETLGAVRYDRGRTTMAYQGGGVWRSDGSGSTMVSPPEFHYRQGTLTLPLVRVRSDGFTGRSARITQTTPVEGKYPNASRSNPLTQGRVTVTVQSDYYEAWGAFFEDRTTGDVTYDHAEQTAKIELQTPFKEEFDNVLSTTDGGIRANGGDPPSPSETDVNYRSADSRIESQIQDCRDSDDCKAWTPDIDSSGRYYTDSDVKNDDISIDTSDGNVSLVVDGSFEPNSVTITGDNTTTVFVKGDVEFGEANEGGSPDDFRVLVHSASDVSMGGNAVFVGLLYAPESDITLNGNGKMTGSIIGEQITINGQPANDFTHDPSVTNVNLGIGPGAPPVLYLHVSVTTVTVENG
ncbi:DUF7289 family protein [Haloplanus halobius]|uniref:DUF7289 family protein n=1 Tax=Haloplanus halobius TaxID=2934938 RepID=UPI00200CE910|nr:hypothetical protein [Haloplanus sp. XH21]